VPKKYGCDSGGGVLWAFVSDDTRIAVTRFSAPGTYVTDSAGSPATEQFQPGTLSAPEYNIAVDASGEVWLVTSSGGNIVKYSRASGFTTPTTIVSPGGVTRLLDLYHLSDGTFAIVYVNQTSGQHSYSRLDANLGVTGTVNLSVISGTWEWASCSIMQETGSAVGTVHVWHAFRTSTITSRVYLQRIIGTALSTVSAAELVTPFGGNSLFCVNGYSATSAKSEAYITWRDSTGMTPATRTTIRIQATPLNAGPTAVQIVGFEPQGQMQNGLMLGTNGVACNIYSQAYNGGTGHYLVGRVSDLGAYFAPLSVHVTSGHSTRRISTAFSGYECFVAPTVKSGETMGALVWCKRGAPRIGLDRVLGPAPLEYPVGYSNANRYNLSPIGISQPPEFTLTSVAGSLTGVYTYAIAFRCTFPDGTSVLSPYRSATTTLAANNVQIDFWISAYPDFLSTRLKFSIVIFRTDANASIYKKIYESSGITATSTTAWDFMTVTDPGFLGQETFPYQTELAPTPMPPTESLVVYDSRLVALGQASGGKKIYYSKTKKQDRAYEWGPVLVFSSPEPLVAIATQDGNIYGFSSASIYAISVSFANDDGTGTSEARFTNISQGVGCSTIDSLVTTPVGLFWTCGRGFYAIPRGAGGPAYIGSDIERTFKLYPNVTGVAFNETTSEVLWSCNDGFNHMLFVYNWLNQQWFTWRVHNGQPLMLQGGAACVSGSWYLADTTTNFVLSKSTALDAVADSDTDTISTTRSVTSTIETSDVMISEFGEFQRTRFLSVEANKFTGSASQNLTVSESVDSGTTYGTVRVYTSPLSEGQAKYYITNQKNQSIRFKLTCQGQVRFPGVTLTVQKNGRARTQSAQMKG
jgi:hypothetical protein